MCVMQCHFAIRLSKMSSHRGNFEISTIRLLIFLLITIFTISVKSTKNTENFPEIPKCCNLNEVWNFTLYPDGPIRCGLSGPLTWSPKIFSSLQSKSPLPLSTKIPIPKLVPNHPRNWCSSEIQVHSDKKNKKVPKRAFFRVLLDGSVWVKKSRRFWNKLQLGTYCLDGARNFNDEEEDASSGVFEDTVIIECAEHYGLEYVDESCEFTNPDPSNSYAISLLVSSVFLLITSIVYILLWEKQNVHGWTSLCYFASLFGMYIFTALLRYGFAFAYNQQEQGISCWLIALFLHFFWLSAFCWMSCVNFDLWWTFRALLPTGSKSKGLKRFLSYCLFSLTVPASIVGLGVLLDHLYGDDWESDVIVPQYGKLSCSLDLSSALFPFLYLPIGILLTCNLIFFTITIVEMYRIKQSTKLASASSSKNSGQKETILLFLKLFLLMGIPWVFELISWLTTPCGQIPWYWKIADYINIFQAVAIFLAFACKSETISGLENKFPLFKRFTKLITISPERSEAILENRPYLKFLIKPLTRKKSKSMPTFSSSKTNSTGLTGTSGEGTGRSQQSVKKL